ncbi:hypothetical protein M0E87_03395 [Corynebacterium sp. CCM 9185]|uniref:Uncharacterized protein n=2 Tax=Corynebacterium marambiense TaxID=2765364 RepID=A0ABS0VU24_9CORY|nr:hypothetical protein [Corynebacterium marambiense]MBI8999871.1 hypothetical protein [Corynebacterium marambiense]MCK7662709.1 hypothetical protein [Corynebacterium marambiense]MCX7543720.1 hypothetical protein [Corynebacterium marambiense]
MDNTAVIITMASVFIGFLLFGGSYASFSYRRSPKLTWTLFTFAIFFITVIPTVIAVFWATLFAGSGAG